MMLNKLCSPFFYILSMVFVFAASATLIVEPCLAKDNFRAACVKVDITPDSPQWLHGYGPRQSNGIRDRIYHRVAIMADGDQLFCLVSTDVCTISPSFYQRFSARLEKETGIPPSHFWWTTTHTHSAPHLGPQDLAQFFGSTLGDRFSIKLDEPYWVMAQDRLLAAIVQAKAKLEPAKLGIGVGSAAANVNRRERNAKGEIVLGVNPTGPVDRQLGLLRLERMDGSLIGLVANYAIHGTTFNSENVKISGDVTGIVAEYVEQKTGVPLLFINGAEGNVAPLYSVGGAIDSPLLERYKSLLGDPILDLSSSIKNSTSTVSLRPDRLEVLTPRKESLGWLDDLESYTSKSESGQNLIRLPIYTLLINEDTFIWGAPVELFSEISIAIRNSSPYENTLFFGLTNGSMLYLPTSSAFDEGGYEPNVSIFTAHAEADVISNILKTLPSRTAGNTP